MKKKYKVGLVIGRFQPFHLGHKYLIERAFEFCDKIIIGVGSSNITDDKNPYSLKDRIQFVKKFASEEKIESKVLKIVPIEDVPDDDEWLKLTLKETGVVDVEIGDNEWVNGIFEKAGIPVIRIGFHRRKILEGTKIRKRIRESKSWEDRIPEYLVPNVKKR